MYDRKISARDAIIWGILALLTGGILIFLLFEPKVMNRDIIKINLGEEGQKVVSFSDFSLLPGEETEYKILFDEVDLSTYDVVLQFKTETDYAAYDFLCVRIIVDGKVLCDRTLSEVFADDPLFLQINPIEDRSVEIKVVYYIPLDTGNEAENMTFDFDLIITATTQQDPEEVIK